MGKEWVAAASLHKTVLYFPSRLLRINTRVDGSSNIQRAPGGHRRGPVTARDLAHINIDRMIQRIEVGVVKSTLIPGDF